MVKKADEDEGDRKSRKDLLEHLGKADEPTTGREES
jgi:hypothetical protein